MTGLNLDCWRVVFDLLESETRTLYSCLFVSKVFFSLSTRVLYRRPLQVFEGQRDFSSFSRLRLANLLETCSGFATPSTVVADATFVPTAVSVRKQPSSSSSSTTTKKLAKKITPNDTSLNFRPALVPTTSSTDQPISTPPTINYYKLVLEYPKSVTVREDIPRWQEYVTCFTETIPVLQISVQHFDFILPLVSRFRALHTMSIYPPPPSPSSPPSPEGTVSSSFTGTFGPVYLEKIVQFIQSHRILFPGGLKELENSFSWKDWKEMVTIQKAMGGMKEQLIVLKQEMFPKQDLCELIGTRLTNLKLICSEGNFNILSGKMVIEFLKGCRVLETLSLSWPKDTVLDWSLLLEKDDKIGLNHDDHDGGGDGDSGNGQLESRSSFTTTAITTTTARPPLGQPQPFIKLKNLIVRGGATVAMEAMKVFKDTLESIKIQWRNQESHLDPFFDWQCSFTMTKLKSIELEDHFCFQLENLICCPALETLVVPVANIPQTFSRWSTCCWPSIPISLRKLHFTGEAANEFDIFALKPLRNLEHLHLFALDRGICQHLPLLEISQEWHFPKLKHVALFGRFSIQIQGQILWIAPKLESLSLCLWVIGHACELDTDTFLFPPAKLDPRATTETTTQTKQNNLATFPVLKSLTLRSFQLLKIPTVEEFGDVFFGPRPFDPLKGSNTGTVDNNGSGLEANDGFRDTCTQVDNLNRDRYLFPNLEALEFFWDRPIGFLQPCILRAMRNMPKLERVCYREWGEESSSSHLGIWLQEVPEDRLGKDHENYRNRPWVPVGSSSIIQRNSRCVVEFDRPRGIRYQSKASKPSVMDRTKENATRIWKQMFSR